MSISTAEKAQIVGEYQQAKNDTGSPEVQVALLSSRISYLTEHAPPGLPDRHLERMPLRRARGKPAVWP